MQAATKLESTELVPTLKEQVPEEDSLVRSPHSIKPECREFPECGLMFFYPAPNKKVFCRAP
jgi:hypothetical protein